MNQDQISDAEVAQAIDAFDLLEGDEPAAPITDGEEPVPETPESHADEAIDDTPAPQEGKTEEKDQKRYQYWQAVADKTKKQLEELQMVVPLHKMISQDPKALDVLEQYYAKQGQGQPSPEVPAEPEIKAPVPPQMPAHYDEVAAYSDPESESFKFRIAEKKFTEQRMEYLEKSNEQFRQRVEREQKERQVREQRAQEMAKIQAEAIKRGLTPEQAQEFLQWGFSGQSSSLDNIIALFQMNKGIQVSTLPGAKQGKDAKLQRIVTQQQRHQIPLPADVAITGEEDEGADSEPSEEDQVNAAFMKAKRPPMVARGKR